MPDQTFQGRPSVKVDGTPLPEEVANLIDLLTIDDHLNLPDKLTIVIRDPSREGLDKSHAKIGARIEVGVVSTGRGATDGDVLFKGEITGLEADYDQSGQRVVIRAYDQSHRMHRGRHTEAYLGQSDSDIATKLAQRNQLDLGTIDSSGVVHDHVSQVNLTDWEFIKARAAEIGFEAGVSDGKFFFRRIQVNQGAPGPGDLDATGALQMTFGADLLEFHPRVSAAAQVKDVEARGWSYKEKRAVIGRATTDAENAGPSIPDKPADSASKFPTKKFVITDRVLATDSEVDLAAKGAARQISSAIAEADGVARGNGRLRAGAAIAVAAVADPFKGTWTVTGSRHVFDQQGYRTFFSVAGRQERSILGLASGGASGAVPSAGGPPVYGVVIGKVTNIKDPDGLHRVKLKFPWLSDDYESDWVRCAMAGAGKERGLFWLPEVDDEVLVVFEQGDVRRPYVLAGLYNGVDKPGQQGTSLYDGSGRSVLRGLWTRNKHRIELRDDEGGSKNSVLISTGDEGFQVELSQDQRIIKVTSQDKIQIEATNKVEVHAMEISVKADSNLTLEAGANLEIKAPQVKIEGSGMLDLDGGMVTIN